MILHICNELWINLVWNRRYSLSRPATSNRISTIWAGSVEHNNFNSFFVRHHRCSDFPPFFGLWSARKKNCKAERTSNKCKVTTESHMRDPTSNHANWKLLLFCSSFICARLAISGWQSERLHSEILRADRMVQFHVKYLIFKVPIWCRLLCLAFSLLLHLLIDVLPRFSVLVYAISHFCTA